MHVQSFTPNQRRAIAARGNVLVHAGAGAGKTLTLVERCVSWLLESERNSIEQILMVTFTEAAAAEMRSRIREKLHAVLRQRPEDRRLNEQLALLDSAQISTLHSFCFQLVRQHFYELDLDPQLTVMAAEEAHLLAEDVLTEVLRRHYAGELLHSESIRQLIQVQARGWDLPIRRLVLRLHDYTQTLPAPADWFRHEVSRFRESEPRQWMAWLSDMLPGWRAAGLRELQPFAETPVVQSCIGALEKPSQRLTFPEMFVALQSVHEADNSAATWPRGTKSKVRKHLELFFQEAEFLRSLLEDAPNESKERETLQPLREDWEWSRHPLIALLQLTQEFADAFAAAKREQGMVDFHDLEQFTLRLLGSPSREQPTALAEHWRSRLRMIFVDEYQDINAAQDAILRSLGREGIEANRFLVGDLKQSIYRFRLANPRIFQDYAERWQTESENAQVIPLTVNFRSHRAILDFVNAFFEAVMRKEIGGVEFGPASRLESGLAQERQAATTAQGSGSRDREEPSGCVELLFRVTGAGNDEKPDDGEDDGESPSDLSELSNAELEARMIGQRIQALVRQKFEVWDDSLNRFRPCQFQDFVILLRSRQGKAEAFAKEFSRLHVPLAASRAGFFESPEIMDLVNLLKLLDNPLQDVETIAVLRSPLVGLTLEELATVRLAAQGPFWTALQAYKNQMLESERTRPESSGSSEYSPSPPRGPRRTAYERIRLFTESFSRWRTLVRQGSISQSLEQILDDTFYLARVCVQPRGEQQRANVAKLLTWARQFDQQHRQGLFHFLRFIDAQRTAEIEHEPAPVQAEQAVRLMSIHQSKGLEFPIVFVADLGKAFNLSDLAEDIILDEEYGLCSKVQPPMTHHRYPSLPYWLAQRRQRAEALGEEMRILYVAMTRARHKLILTGTVSRKRVENAWPLAAELAGRNILHASSCLDWIGPWFCRTVDQSVLSSQTYGKTALFTWTLYDGQDSRLAISPEPIPDTKESNGAVQALTESTWSDLEKRLSSSYSYAASTTEPAKASVSSLRRRAMDDEPAEARALSLATPREFATSKRSESKLSAVEVGNAHHVFLQYVSLESDLSVIELEKEAHRLEREGTLSTNERAALDIPGMAAFWQDEVGQIIRAHRSSLHREMPFTVRLNVRELKSLLQRPTAPDSPISKPGSALEGEEYVVVQGIVDLAVVLHDEIWILDLKTDAVSETDGSERAEAYGLQLKLYRQALSRIHHKPVTHAWLYFLAIGKTVEASKC